MKFLIEIGFVIVVLPGVIAGFVFGLSRAGFELGIELTENIAKWNKENVKS